MRTLVFSLLLSLIALPVFALDLDAAKIQGLVGEQPDGYIGAVQSNPGGDVLQLVSSVNSQRRTHYQGISQSSNLPLATVESLAGAKLIQRVPSGQYVRNASRQWVKK